MVNYMKGKEKIALFLDADNALAENIDVILVK